jgi:hypothetical protein
VCPHAVGLWLNRRTGQSLMVLVDLNYITVIYLCVPSRAWRSLIFIGIPPNLEHPMKKLLLYTGATASLLHCIRTAGIEARVVSVSFAE